MIRDTMSPVAKEILEATGKIEVVVDNDKASNDPAALAKITGDDKYFLVAGNRAGGLQLFSEIKSNDVDEIANAAMIHQFYANQKIHLSFQENIHLQDITIYNILGEEVMRKSLSENEKNIDVKPLASGCYIAKTNYIQNGNSYFALLKFIQ